ncbi:MAG: hypothetical protein IPJ89_02560 [Candidatus Iainarchaeum archaeon]|uniref:Aminopeptidase n=1 Tax=Candidatus Iainarchaeum sp. TaxID=3101447 RepID=A0A7T9I2J0_9ARCH|nr:MAG: hypothetical protein IPJ89_02560 [Candidatus Diapherotrites archaeon]
MPLPPSLKKELQSHLHEMVFSLFKVKSKQNVVIIHDQQSPLSKIVTQGYRDALKEHGSTLTHFWDFDAFTSEQLIEKINALKEGDLVVLVQSSSFRVSVYRWRLELFARKLKVIEHMRLSYMKESEFPTYIHSLKNDSPYYVKATEKIANLLRKSKHIKVECMQGSILEIHSEMEEPITNTGVYEEGENWGGGFPIGEIFSEPKDITKWSGAVEVFAYPGEDHKMVFTPKPFIIHLKEGHVEVEKCSFPKDFLPLIRMMESENKDGKIPIREFGMGLNRALSKQHPLTEATAWERVNGLHLSLGMKHGVYQKKFNKNKEIQQRYHIDIYPDVKRIWIAEELVYDKGMFLL